MTGVRRLIDYAVEREESRVSTMQDYILGQDLKQDHRFLSTYYYKRFDRELNVPFPKYVVAWRMTCNLKSIPCRLYCRTGKKESLKCLLTSKITFEYKIWNKTIDFLLEREPNVPFPKCLQRNQELRRNHWWDWGVPSSRTSGQLS